MGVGYSRLTKSCSFFVCETVILLSQCLPVFWFCRFMVLVLLTRVFSQTDTPSVHGTFLDATGNSY